MSSLPDVEALHSACVAFLNECLCSLCSEPWQKASTFPCGHTFCYECAIATIEGPGISQSECPTCQAKFWKRDLRPNPQIMAVVEHAQKLLGITASRHAELLRSGSNNGLRYDQQLHQPVASPQPGLPERDPDQTAAASGPHRHAAEADANVLLCRDDLADACLPGLSGWPDPDQLRSSGAAPMGGKANGVDTRRAHEELLLRVAGAAGDVQAGDPPLVVERQQQAAPDSAVTAARKNGVADPPSRRAGAATAPASALVGEPSVSLARSGPDAARRQEAAGAVFSPGAQTRREASLLTLNGQAAEVHSDGGQETTWRPPRTPSESLANGAAFSFRAFDGQPANSFTHPGPTLRVAGLPNRHPHSQGAARLAQPWPSSAWDVGASGGAMGHMAATPRGTGSEPGVAGPPLPATGSGPPMATPQVQQLPPLRSPPQGLRLNSESRGRVPPYGTACGLQRPGSVVSIRRSTPSVNNAYLEFHALLEDAVIRMAADPDAVVPHPDARQKGLAEDCGGWLAFNEAAWFRQLARLPWPTEQECEALGFELSIVEMFLGELDQEILATQGGQARSGAGAPAETAAASALEAGEAVEMAAAGVEAVGAAPHAAAQACAVAVGPSGPPSAVTDAREDVGTVQQHTADGEGKWHGLASGQGARQAPTQHAGGGVGAAACEREPGPNDDPAYGAGGPGCSSVPPVQLGADVHPEERPEPTGDQPVRAAASTDQNVATVTCLAAQSAVGRTGQAAGKYAAPHPTRHVDARGCAGGGCIVRLAVPEGAPEARGQAAERADGQAGQDEDGKDLESARRPKRARTQGPGASPSTAIQCPPPPAGQAVGSDKDLNNAMAACSAQHEAEVDPEPRGRADSALGQAGTGGAGETEPGGSGCCKTCRRGEPAQTMVEGPSPRPLPPALPLAHQREAQPDAVMEDGPRAAARADCEPKRDVQDARGPVQRRGRRETAQQKRQRSNSAHPAPDRPGPRPQHPPAEHTQPQPQAKAAGPQRAARRGQRRETPAAAQPVPTQTAAMEGAANRRGKSLFILSTGLSGQEKDKVKELARRIRNVELLDDVTPTMTHLVVSLTGDGRASARTVKYLRAVMQGCWVVGIRWAEACLAAGKLVPESPFEATGDTYAEGTPAKSRLRVERGEPALFSGLSFCVNHLKGLMEGKVYRADVEALLQVAGACIVRRPAFRPAAAEPTTAAAAIFGMAAIADPYDEGPPSQQLQHPQQDAVRQLDAAEGPQIPSGVPPVVVLLSGPSGADAARVVREWGYAPISTSWVYDSISSYRVLPVEPYVIMPESETNTSDLSVGG